MAAARYVFCTAARRAAFFTRPFYDPQTFRTSKAVLGGTSLAVLTYIGFDGISTLSEEAENPRRNILLATVLTASSSEFFPRWKSTPRNLSGRLAALPERGHRLRLRGRARLGTAFAIVGLTLLVATSAQAWVRNSARPDCSIGMGRSKALPKSFFGAVDPKRHVPRNNVIFVGVLALAGALLVSIGLFSYGLGAEMLNFGALIAFMGVNMAAFVRYYVREGGKSPIPPLVLTALVIALVLLPTSNWIVLAVAGRDAGYPGRVGTAAGRVHHLFFPVEEPELESLDRGRHLDAGRNPFRRDQDEGLPR